MATDAFLFILLIYLIFTKAASQNVLTRILPSEKLFLETNGPSGTEGYGRAVIWCLVQDFLSTSRDDVVSLELFFEHGHKNKLMDHTEETKGTENSSSSSVRQLDNAGNRIQGGEQPESVKGDQDSMMQNMNLTKLKLSEEFPDAEFSHSNKKKERKDIFNVKNETWNKDQTLEKINSPNAGGPAKSKRQTRNVLTKKASSRIKNKAVRLRHESVQSKRLTRRSLAERVTVARMTLSNSAKLGVRYEQRPGVSVRGVISTTNPNLSSLQVDFDRANCSDSGRYTCVMRYQSKDSNVTDMRSGSSLIVSQFSVQRLNVIATSTPSPPNDSFAASNASGFTEFYCFGTIPDPDSSLFWMWRGAEINSSYVPYPWSERIHEEEVQVDQNCQYWRGNTLRHVWTGYDNVLHLRCSLSRDGNGHSAVCSKFQGITVQVACGAPNSTFKLDLGVSIRCDITDLSNITSVIWNRAESEVGRCDVRSNSTNFFYWDCMSVEPRYSLVHSGQSFYVHITEYLKLTDAGLWGCTVVPLFDEPAATCILG